MSGFGCGGSRDQFICARCEEPADEDEAPSYCPSCGWNGFNYSFDNKLPEEVTHD